MTASEPPQWRAPMLASALRLPDDAAVLRRGEWSYERKLDGLRCIAVCDGPRVELWSRNRLRWTGRFPLVAADLAGLGIGPSVLDGELAAFDRTGATSFQLLQGGDPQASAVYVAFDLLHLLGRDTTGLPYTERTGLLRRALQSPPPHVQVSLPLAGDPEDLLRQACQQGWEGLVAKRSDSPYRSGRSPDWRKLKCSARQELVIGGWTEPTGARSGFGALLVGYHDRGRLLYAGKVGTGFDERTLRSLHTRMVALGRETSPFADLAHQRGAHWVRPELVAEVAFTEWTRDGRLRHPSFLGLRPDKEPGQVVRETGGRPPDR
ncbi:MAG TPA: non-homologous end-joining DNA ligase [Acidimicrobiales bacterium]|nr:non-homologous end-joining DNA ligase [Acidimicrobiales bacterium]